MCNRAANPGECLCLVPDVGDLFDVFLVNRVEADDAAAEVLLLRTLHVHHVERAMARLPMCVNLVIVVSVLVHGVDYLRSLLVPALLVLWLSRTCQARHGRALPHSLFQ